MLPVGGCDHAVSATTCQRFGFDLCGFRGAALDQSRSASGVYTGNFGDAKEGTGYVLYYRHFVTVTKRTGQDVFLEYRRHAADTPKHLGQGMPRHPNAVTPERSEGAIRMF